MESRSQQVPVTYENVSLSVLVGDTKCERERPSPNRRQARACLAPQVPSSRPELPRSAPPHEYAIRTYRKCRTTPALLRGSCPDRVGAGEASRNPDPHTLAGIPSGRQGGEHRATDTRTVETGRAEMPLPAYRPGPMATVIHASGSLASLSDSHRIYSITPVHQRLLHLFERNPKRSARVIAQ